MSKLFMKEAIDMTFSISKRNEKTNWNIDGRHQTVGIAYVYARGINSVIR